MLDLQPLRAATFRHLAAAYSINELGNIVGDVALALLVFNSTHSPLATATLFLALRFLPALVAQFMTSRLEVIPARGVLPALYLCEAAIYVALAIVAHHFSLVAVLILAAVDGAFAITAKALTRSAVATHLMRRDLLREGNAILNLIVVSGTAIGPAIGGVIAEWRGVGAALALDAATFLVTATIIATTPRLRIVSDTEAGVWGRMRGGIRAVQSQPLLRRLFVACGLALVLGSVAVPVEVVFAKQTLHAGDSGYGYLLGAWGLGAVIGAALFAIVTRAPVMVVLAFSALLIAVGYGGLALSPSLAVAVCFSAIGGIGNGIAGIAAITAIQAAIPLRAQSVVMAALEGMNTIAPAIGFIVGGAITAIASARAAYAVSAVGVAVVVVGAALRPLRTSSLSAADGQVTP